MPLYKVVILGEGGVGKSSVAANLAIAIANRGKSVACIDADVWGYSMPRMLGITNPPVVIDEMYDNDSVSDHLNKAQELWSENKTKLLPIKIVAGNCMIFHKSLWLLCGGFDESKLFFDKYFSYKVAEIVDWLVKQLQKTRPIQTEIKLTAV